MNQQDSKKSPAVGSSGYLILCTLVAALIATKAREFVAEASPFHMFIALVLICGSVFVASAFIYSRCSKAARDLAKLKERVKQIPIDLIKPLAAAVLMGTETDLKIKLYLPDSIRSRHVHIIGSTGSGKTESVVLNFLKQDVARGFGAIILDAKGDRSFMESLRSFVPEERLKIFDLGDESSLSYNPLEIGSALEGAQRLFSSLIWSEEYYKSKALSSLQRIFQNHSEKFNKNPNFLEVSRYLCNNEEYNKLVCNKEYLKAAAEKDFLELSGLRDQIRSLSTGYLAKILSPESSQIQIEKAGEGQVVYFRLQSMMSPQIVVTLGRLLINHLSYMAGSAHRSETKDDNGSSQKPKMLPVYLDEFASFACPEFGDLISKARSAGLALHFSHQSIGDLIEISDGFLSRITDNSATKIVMRINDPDSADFFARAFGTQLYQKVTQRLVNSKDVDTAEMLGEGSVRDAHQFRASPDLLKTLPTGVGAVLVAHGIESPDGGASSVFKVRFPMLDNPAGPNVSACSTGLVKSESASKLIAQSGLTSS